MPLFRVTRKLAKALKLKIPAPIIAHANVEHEWFADLFYFEGKKCVMWTHRPTLFTFVKPAVVAPELRQFNAIFRNELSVVIASMGLPEALAARLGTDDEEQYAPANDRRVVGSMVDYRRLFEGYVGRWAGCLERADMRYVNAKLNDAPMSVLEMESAEFALRRLAATPGS